MDNNEPKFYVTWNGTLYGKTYMFKDVYEWQGLCFYIAELMVIRKISGVKLEEIDPITLIKIWRYVNLR